EARQEPITAIVVLAGIAIVLATNVAGQLLDEHAYDGVLIAVWAFFAGAIYGFASYWFAGFALYLGQRGAGTLAKARPARHVLAYAAVPLIVWLALVWPVRLAFYRTDLFRTGGGDDHAGRFAFDAIAVVFALWAAGLLAFGLRTRYEWDWRRSAVALSLAIAAFALLGFAAALILRGSHHS